MCCPTGPSHGAKHTSNTRRHCRGLSVDSFFDHRKNNNEQLPPLSGGVHVNFSVTIPDDDEDVVLSTSSSTKDDTVAATQSITTTSVRPRSCSLTSIPLEFTLHTTSAVQIHETTSSHAKKSVSFSTVEIQEYSIIIGDSPSVSKGLPITLSWEHTDGRTLTVDAYEQSRFGKRRGVDDLSLSPSVRNNKLVSVGGYTERELWRAQRRITLREREEFFGRPTAM